MCDTLPPTYQQAIETKRTKSLYSLYKNGVYSYTFVSLDLAESFMNTYDFCQGCIIVTIPLILDPEQALVPTSRRSGVQTTGANFVFNENGIVSVHLSRGSAMSVSKKIKELGQVSWVYHGGIVYFSF